MSKFERIPIVVVVDGFIEPLTPNSTQAELDLEELKIVTSVMLESGYSARSAITYLGLVETTVEQIALASLFKGGTDISKEQYDVIACSNLAIGPYVKPLYGQRLNFGIALWDLSQNPAKA